MEEQEATYDMKTMKRVLKEARKVMEKGWCQEYEAISGESWDWCYNENSNEYSPDYTPDFWPCSARDHKARHWCLTGALDLAVYRNCDPTEERYNLYFYGALEILFDTIPPCEKETVCSVYYQLGYIDHDVLHVKPKVGMNIVVTGWNDMPGRTKEEVVALVRKAENSLDERPVAA